MKQKNVLRLAGHESQVNRVAFSPDGGTLASGAGDGKVKLWDVRTGQEKATLGGSRSTIVSVAFRPDGKALAFASLSGEITLYQLPGARGARAHPPAR
jgi:WD40 repeat protein